jgi:hypothetical protein
LKASVEQVQGFSAIACANRIPAIFIEDQSNDLANILRVIDNQDRPHKPNLDQEKTIRNRVEDLSSPPVSKGRDIACLLAVVGSRLEACSHDRNLTGAISIGLDEETRIPCA